jgi:hypothetical protein
VNARYSFQGEREFLEKNPDATSFFLIQCWATNLIEPLKPLFRLYRRISTVPKDVFKQYVHETILYSRSPETGFKWKVDNAQFNTLEPVVQKEIMNAFNLSKEKIAPIKQGSVKVLSHFMQCYDEQSISRLFRSQRLEVESTCIVGEDGHLIKGDPFETGMQIVIVCKNPNK